MATSTSRTNPRRRSRDPRVVQDPHFTFTGGEVGPEVGGRPDLALYLTSSSLVENVRTSSKGGMANRTGFERLAKCRSGPLGSTQDSLLWNFDRGIGDEYLIEVGVDYPQGHIDGGYFRFTKEGVAVTEATTVLTSITGGLLVPADDWTYFPYDDLRIEGTTDDHWNGRTLGLAGEVEIIGGVVTAWSTSPDTDTPSQLTSVGLGGAANDGQMIYVTGPLGGDFPDLDSKFFHAKHDTSDTYDLYLDPAMTVPLDTSEFGSYNISTGTVQRIQGNSFDLTAEQDLPPLSAGHNATGGTIARVFTVWHPYTAAEIPELRYDQSGDIITIWHPDHPDRELVRGATDTDWVLRDKAWGASIAAPVRLGAGQSFNYDASPVALPDRAYRYAITYVGFDGVETQPAKQANSTKRIGVIDSTSDSSWIPIALDGGFVQAEILASANPPTVKIPHAGDGYDFDNGDALYFYGWNGSTPTALNGQDLVVNSGITEADDTRRGLELQFTVNINYTGGNAFGYVVKATHKEIPTDVYSVRLYRQTSQFLDVTTFAVGLDNYELVTELAADDLRVDSDDPLAATEWLTHRWTDRGDIAPDPTTTPPLLSTRFKEAGEYAKCGGYYQQRLVMAAPDNRPNEVVGSPSSNFISFDEPLFTKDSDIIIAQIGGRQFSKIMHILGTDRLYVFTESGVDQIDSDEDAVWTPATTAPRTLARYGCSSIVRPELVAETPVFVNETGEEVRNLYRGAGTAVRQSAKLSVLVDHFFADNPIVSMAYTQHPEPTIWVACEDGNVYAATYMPEQEVLGWHRHGTDGDVKSLQEGRYQGEDALYAIVERQGPSTTYQQIERLSSRRYSDIGQAIFVDDAQAEQPVAALDTIAAWSATGLGYLKLDTTSAHGLNNGDIIDTRGTTESVTVNGIPREEPFPIYDGRYEVEVQDPDTLVLKQNGVYVEAAPYETYRVATGGSLYVPVTSFDGFHHLAGVTVRALINGETIETITVAADGSITTTYAGIEIVVGRHYKWRVRSLRADQGGGSLLGRNVRMGALRFILQDSRSFSAGALEDGEIEDVNADYLVPVNPYDYHDLTDTRTPYSGVLDVVIEGDWEETGQFYLEGSQPLPVEILGIIAKVHHGD